MNERAKWVRGVTGMHLFAHRCRCGHLNVHGFWQQLEKGAKTERHVEVRMPCEMCGSIRIKRYRLTTSTKVNHRLINWTSLFMWLLVHLAGTRWLKNGRASKLAVIFLWLDARVRI